MLRPLVLVGSLALGGCSSELPPPGPGFPDQVRSVRLYDGDGVDRTTHVFLFNNVSQLLEVRLFADDGQNLLEVRGGLEMTLTFRPDGMAVSSPMPGEILKHAVTTYAPPGTLGSIFVTLRFLEDGSEKTFGPFECLVH